MTLAERVLVRPPTGRDGELTRNLLRQSGISACLCDGLDEMARELGRGAGIRTLQCAPLLGTAGRPLGVMSVYSSVPVRESETRRVLFDLLARQAAELIERDQAERERRAADRRKDEFLATLAHELRNPLAPIRQAARVARAPLATPEQQRWSTEIIERQVNHMALRLDDLLDVDPLRLAQVLANLLDNAAKYTDRGGRISLSSRLHGDRLSIHVRDNGIGLALVRGLVEMHGGRVEARSEGPGLGSEFIVSLALPTDERTPAVAPACSSLRARTPSERRILVADDNVDAAESLAVLLRLEGHVVEVVHDGEAALSAARGPLALIAVTGWGQSEDRHQARLAGFDHHLTKPVDFERLLALVAGARMANDGTSFGSPRPVPRAS